MTPRASHIVFTMNQNWCGSSFPSPLNTGSLIALAMLNCGFGEDGGETSEAGEGVSGGDNYKMRCPIKLTALLGEILAHSSSLSREGEIKELFPNPSIPL